MGVEDFSFFLGPNFSVCVGGRGGCGGGLQFVFVLLILFLFS